MQQILNTIDKVDIFGVPVSLLTAAKASLYQSKLGGLITILIGGISLTYFLYVIIQWIDHQIPAIVSIKQQTISYAEFQLIIRFSGDVDPFRKENNIITPNLYRILNTTIIDKPIPIFSSEDKPFKISIDNGTIVLNHDFVGVGDHFQMTQLLLVLEGCSNLTAVSGSYCADENVINEYLTKFHGFLFLTIRLNQLKYTVGELEDIEKQYYTAFELSKPLYSQVLLKQQETVVDDGILFTNNNYYKFLNNYELIHQPVDNFSLLMWLAQFQKSSINSRVLVVIYLELIIFLFMKVQQCQSQDKFQLKLDQLFRQYFCQNILQYITIKCYWKTNYCMKQQPCIIQK